MLTEMTELDAGGGSGRTYQHPLLPEQAPTRHRSPTRRMGSAGSVGWGSHHDVSQQHLTQQLAPSSPLVSSCRHLQRPNGSILGSEVAQAILPLFPTFASAIPVDVDSKAVPNSSSYAAHFPLASVPSSSSMAGGAHGHNHPHNQLSHALAAIDGRRPIGHARIRDFVLSDFGPALHGMGYGRGHRVAVVLPNGPELAMAILSIAHWASCVPLNAAGSVGELEKDLLGAGVDLVIGPHSGPPVSVDDVSAKLRSADVFVSEGGIVQSFSADACDAAATLATTPHRKSRREHTPHHFSRYAVMPSAGKDPSNNAAVASDFVAFDHVRETAERLGIPFVGLQPSRTEAGIFALVGTASARKGGGGDPVNGRSTHQQRNRQQYQRAEADLLGMGSTSASGSVEGGAGAAGAPPGRSRSGADGDSASHLSRYDANTHEDEVLVLFTSGTTGTKKLVPHHLGEMLVATATIALSWNLTPFDTNCNLMPLFHVGGIVRQVFSPVLSGGCVICCPNFDPSIFWALLNNRAFNWYYAAPTMHQIILQTGKEHVALQGRDSSLVESTQPRLRMIANAAGGLLPSLATELRKTFHANVLPSYGMTECMPISSPPHDYELERPGTSGVAVGPEISILDTSVDPPAHFPPMREGPICVRGSPCFRGYGHNNSSSEGSHAVEAKDSFLTGGWFNTGDLGYLDPDGYLYITGRSKEVINRGGEIISPLEVEEAVLAHPAVQACAAFSAMHDVLQEVVGIAVVPEPGLPRTDLQDLHEFLGQERLAAPKWPQCLVFMDALPKSNTNKLLRVNLARRLGLPEINDRLYPVERTFEARCPRQGTDVKEPIHCEQVKIDVRSVQAVLREALVGPEPYNSAADGYVNPLCEGGNSCTQLLTGLREVIVTHHPAKIGSVVCYVRNVDRLDAIRAAQDLLDRYAVPSHFVALDPDAAMILSERDLLPPQPSDAVSALLQGLCPEPSGPVDPLVVELQKFWSELLDLDCLPHPNTNFFNLGGSSMLASQLAARLRKMHRVPLSGAEIFHHSSCAALAKLIHERKQEATGGGTSAGGGGGRGMGGGDGRSVNSEAGVDRSVSADSYGGGVGSLQSTRKDMDLQGARFSPVHLAPKDSIFAKAFQLLPLMVVYPTFQLTRFFMFFYTLINILNHVPGRRNIWKFILTVMVFHVIWVTITPLVFVLVKWTVIGRYKAGRYPIWGSYYLRWWFVDLCGKIIGRGIFGKSDVTLNFYYRLLGARIGHGARVSISATIGEYDLITIGERAAVDACTLRPFGLDNGAMILGPVTVGDEASVGYKSVVAPDTSVPNGAHLGAQSTSYETGRALKPSHARHNRYTFPSPHGLVVFFGGYPITLFVTMCTRIPPLFVLWLMLRQPWRDRGGDDSFRTMGDMLEWLCDPRRIPYYIGIRITRNMISPLVHMFLAVLVKRCIIGKFEPGPRDCTSQWQLLRHWLAATLLTREKLLDVTKIIGRHYEGVSILYRLLGAKVGKRVFWPGSQLTTTGEFDLLEIGDDVVFGSRTAIFMSTADSLEPVRLSAGSNVADNCVILAGSTLGKNAVLGSNGICPSGWYLPESSVWFGSRGCEPLLLERGYDDGGERGRQIAEIRANGESCESICPLKGDESTLRPFGKAFYKREASYFVWPLAMVNVMNAIVTMVIVIIHSFPTIGAVHVCSAFLYGIPFDQREYDNIHFRPGTVYVVLLLSFFITHFIRTVLWLVLEVGSKWAIIGRRQVGRYNWDISSYNQRWEFQQTFRTMRKVGRTSFLDLISGTPYLNQLFRVQGATIGRDVCLYPAGGDPWMSEPCLVTIGDRCAVDCASIVCHLNTRGNFELGMTVLDEHTTLRTRSRIQMGGRMERGSMLLEHSLAMTGEIIEADSVWYGAPAVPIMYLGLPNVGRQPSRPYMSNELGAALV